MEKGMMAQERISLWLDESGHIASNPKKAPMTRASLVAEIDRLYLEYIQQYALGKYESYLIDALNRDADDRAQT
jgi:hypothetical protein